MEEAESSLVDIKLACQALAHGEPPVLMVWYSGRLAESLKIVSPAARTIRRLFGMCRYEATRRCIVEDALVEAADDVGCLVQIGWLTGTEMLSGVSEILPCWTRGSMAT